MSEEIKTKWRNFYGRRHGKTLRGARRDCLGDLGELAPRGICARG